jgi:hypothetical protein
MGRILAFQELLKKPQTPREELARLRIELLVLGAAALHRELFSGAPMPAKWCSGSW